MGASVTAVREAIIQLEAEGLITKRTNTTTNVSVLTDRRDCAKRSSCDMRWNGVAMIEAARRAKADDVRHLREFLAG